MHDNEWNVQYYIIHIAFQGMVQQNIFSSKNYHFKFNCIVRNLRTNESNTFHHYSLTNPFQIMIP